MKYTTWVECYLFLLRQALNARMVLIIVILGRFGRSPLQAGMGPANQSPGPTHFEQSDFMLQVVVVVNLPHESNHLSK